MIPNAKVEVYTNGDYLNHDYVEALYAEHCRRLHATAHVNWDRYCAEKGKAYLLKLVEKLGFKYTVITDTQDMTICEIHVGKKCILPIKFLILWPCLRPEIPMPMIGDNR